MKYSANFEEAAPAEAEEWEAAAAAASGAAVDSDLVPALASLAPASPARTFSQQIAVARLRTKLLAHNARA